jgi:hypothetical protein
LGGQNSRRRASPAGAAAAGTRQRSGIIMMMSGISSRAAGDAGTDRFTRLGIGITVVVVLAGSAAELINWGFFGERIRALDAASDGGVFGTIGDIAQAAAAVSAWVLTARVRSARPMAPVLAGLLTFLAVDNVVSLHDHIPHWLVFYLPLLAATFICLIVVGRGRAGVDRLIGAGLVLLVLSFVLHLFAERLLLDLGAGSPTGLAYEIKAVVKHGTEAAGWLLIAVGLLRLSLPRGRHPDPV